jgi:hypothetical protein
MPEGHGKPGKRERVGARVRGWEEGRQDLIWNWADEA